MIGSLRKQTEKQSDLLASKDLSVFMGIQSVTNPQVVEDDEQLSEDQIAYNEAMERGMTDDEEIYFKHIGLAK